MASVPPPAVPVPSSQPPSLSPGTTSSVPIIPLSKPKLKPKSRKLSSSSSIALLSAVSSTKNSSQRVLTVVTSKTEPVPISVINVDTTTTTATAVRTAAEPDSQPKTQLAVSATPKQRMKSVAIDPFPLVLSSSNDSPVVSPADEQHATNNENIQKQSKQHMNDHRPINKQSQSNPSSTLNNSNHNRTNVTASTTPADPTSPMVIIHCSQPDSNVPVTLPNPKLPVSSMPPPNPPTATAEDPAAETATFNTVPATAMQVTPSLTSTQPIKTIAPPTPSVTPAPVVVPSLTPAAPFQTAAPLVPTPSLTRLASTPVAVQRSVQVSVPVAETDVVFVDGLAFNGRGYRVCGVANQRGRRCGRIGTCPFHSSSSSSATRISTTSSSQSSKTVTATTSKRPRSNSKLLPQSPTNTTVTTTNSIPSATNGTTTQQQQGGSAAATMMMMKSNARFVSIPPQKARFKRSWTTDEHRRFLQAMKRHGKGKWKEIAADVKTRTANQCQSHAQKYFLRQAKSDSERKKKSIHDVTDDTIAYEEKQKGTNSKQQPDKQQTQDQQQQQLEPPSEQKENGKENDEKEQGDDDEKDDKHEQKVVLTKPVMLLPRKSGAVPLAPGPAPPSHHPHQFTTARHHQHQHHPHHHIHPNASLTCMNTSAGLTTEQSQQATVPIVFPMSNINGMQYARLVQPFMNAATNSTTAASIVPPPPPAPPPPSKLRVTVHQNGKLKGGMALMLPETFEQFYTAAKGKLHFRGNFNRVFTRSGGEITSLDEMCQDDMLWLSSGEDFRTPK